VIARPLPLLHHDARLAVVDKPSGLVVHRSARASDRDNCVWRLTRQLGRPVHPVHRLDRPTSGVLVFALDPQAARSLAEAFAQRRVHKGYLAVVRGVPPESGTIERPIRDEHGRASPAETRFRRLASVELPHAVGRYATARYALVLAEPATGREHQIRRHLRALNHPLVGDTTWGDSAHNRFFRERFGTRRLLLHAAFCRLPHPDGGTLDLVAPLPAELETLLDALGFAAAASAALAGGAGGVLAR
jgi:tRNA pseudouridine65 synthase